MVIMKSYFELINLQVCVAIYQIPGQQLKPVIIKERKQVLNSYVRLKSRKREHWFGAHNPYRRVFPREVSPPKDCRPVNVTGYKGLWIGRHEQKIEYAF